MKTRKAPAARANTIPDPIFAAIAEHKAVDNRISENSSDADSAWNAWYCSAMRLARTKPTTVAGAGTFVAYIARDIQYGSSDWHKPALKTCAAALKRMSAEASQ